MSQEEIDEALEVFEQDVNLGLNSTRVMGRVLAQAYRSLRLELTEARCAVKDKQDEIAKLRAELTENDEQKFGAMKAKISELIVHNEKIYEALRQMKEDDIRHARVCPQHVKNIDPWVRESALIEAKKEIAAWVESDKQTTLRAMSAEAENKRLREAAMFARSAILKHDGNGRLAWLDDVQYLLHKALANPSGLCDHERPFCHDTPTCSRIANPPATGRE